MMDVIKCMGGNGHRQLEERTIDMGFKEAMEKVSKGEPVSSFGETYSVIYYNAENANVVLIRAREGQRDIYHSIPIADFLTSSTDLPIILTDDGELDVKK